jgi:hypothetical protein
VITDSITVRTAATKSEDNTPGGEVSSPVEMTLNSTNPANPTNPANWLTIWNPWLTSGLRSFQPPVYP